MAQRWARIIDATNEYEHLDMRVDLGTGHLWVYAKDEDFGLWVSVPSAQARQIRDALNEAYPND